MSVVVDANLVVALILPLPYSDQAMHAAQVWKNNGIELYAPLLLEYEVASALRKAVFIDHMTSEAAVSAMHKLMALDIHTCAPTPELHARALHWAERLAHSKTYDAHYLALAEQLQTALWTADQRLVNSARRAGATWVYWIGAGPATRAAPPSPPARPLKRPHRTTSGR